MRESLHPDEKESVLELSAQNFEIGEHCTMEHRRRRHDGVYRRFQTSLQPLRDRDGQVIRWYGVMTDIEDRLAMEESLRLTQAKLAQATQIATASELAAAIVHEISQPLSAIVANTQACLRWLDGSPPNVRDGRKALERIVRDGNDAGAIIKGLRSLFGRAPLEKSELNLRQIATEIVFLLRRKAERAGVVIELQLAHDLPLVLGDKTQLQQVLMNLITNGIESMQSVTHSPKQVIFRAVQQDTHVLASVEDQGIGVSDFNKIFEAFFTTKKTGIGMGLVICKSIIEAHKGKLWGAPNISRGSVFYFTLPHLGD